MLQVIVSLILVYNEMRNEIQKWLTLLGFSLITFINASQFGIYFTNSLVFSEYYKVDNDRLSDTFNLGDIFYIIFILPAIKLTEWRLDYSILAACFLTMASLWIQFILQYSFEVMIASNMLTIFGQNILLPMSPYIAQRWFQLPERAIVIAIGFYANNLGYAFGAILTCLYTGSTPKNIVEEILILAIISTAIFLLSMALVRNKPANCTQSSAPISLNMLKDLWRKKYTAYSVLMASVTLGLSWNFQTQLIFLNSFFTLAQVGGTITMWVICGIAFGLITCQLILKLSLNKGNTKIIEYFCKLVLIVGLIGYTTLGTLFYFQVSSLIAYILVVAIIGVGTLGFYGLTFMALTESLYPIGSLLVGNLICLSASLYSGIAKGITDLALINPFFSIVIISILPFIYVMLAYETKFKRYRFEHNEAEAKFQLMEIKQEEETLKDD